MNNAVTSAIAFTVATEVNAVAVSTVVTLVVAAKVNIFTKI